MANTNKPRTEGTGQSVVDKSNHLLKQHEYVLQIKNNQYHVLQDLGLTLSPDHQGCTVKKL